MPENATSRPASARPPVRPKPLVSLLAIASPLSAAAYLLSVALNLPGYELGAVSLAGLAAGLAALWQIRRSRGRLCGRWPALAGVGVSVALIGWSAMALAKEWRQDRVSARADVVERDLTRLTSACWRYGAKRGGELPPADCWREALEAEGHLKKLAAGGPDAADGLRRYAMNALLGGLRPRAIKDRAKTVLFFECEPGSPQAAGPGNLRRHADDAGYRHSHVIAFADGHCEYRTTDQLDQLNWLPQGKLECPLCGEPVCLSSSWTPEEPIACPTCGWVLRDPHQPPPTAIWVRGSAGLEKAFTTEHAEDAEKARGWVTATTTDRGEKG